jgi:large subunit ribosomal protein L16
MRIFPDKPITKKPPEVTMGGGKGAVEYYAFPIKPGRVIFEIDGVSENKAREALRVAASKLPVKTIFVKD